MDKSGIDATLLNQDQQEQTERRDCKVASHREEEETESET
jgi:hypothetical protein